MLKYMVLLSAVIACVVSQDCKVGGKRCVDHEQCCGGCCFDGECIDTSRSCLETLDVCAGHACLGGQTCSSFLPPHCPGCEPVPLCVDDIF